MRHSVNEDLLNLKKSFIGHEILDKKSIKSYEEGEPLMDYFVMRYNLAINDYAIYGRKNSYENDRKVFADLLTYDDKRMHINKLQKTASMTKILREIFSQMRPSEPFILPNCQEEQPRYLFVFELLECGSVGFEYYRTQTYCCFVCREFIIGDLSNLMNDISSMIYIK